MYGSTSEFAFRLFNFLQHVFLTFKNIFQKANSHVDQFIFKCLLYFFHWSNKNCVCVYIYIYILFKTINLEIVFHFHNRSISIIQVYLMEFIYIYIYLYMYR